MLFDVSMKRKMWWFGTSVFLIVALSGFVWWYVSSDSPSSESIKTVAVERGDIRASVSGSGQVYARSRVDLQPVAAGDAIEVIGVSVKNDQEVKKGDLLVTLDTRDAEKEVRDALLSLRNAEVQFAQTKDLYSRANERDRRQRQLKEIAVTDARNRLLDAREDLEDYRIRAPFDGVVTGLSVSVGDSVSRDDVLASIITKELYADVLLNEVDAANVAVGKSALLSFDALGEADIVGNVSKMDTIGTVEQNVVSYHAEISFDAILDHLKPGMSVEAEIVLDEKRGVLVIPNGSIGSDEDGAFVRAVSGERTAPESKNSESTDRYRKVRIDVGISDETKTEVVRGLSEGDTLLLNASSLEASSSGGSSGSNSRGRGFFPF